MFFIKFKFKRKNKSNNSNISFSPITTQVDIFSKANQHSVLIFEAQPHHGECLPSYIKYFNELGFHVDVLVLKEIIEQNPFCLMPKNADFSIIEANWNNRAEILKNEKILNYKHILISTAICYYSPQSPVIKEFPIFAKHPSVFIVEHDLHDIDVNMEREYLSNNKIVTLWEFKQGAMVNPHYFGDINITPKNVTTFIVVGNIEKKRKNHNLLFNTIENLSKTTQNFHVVIIGKVEDKISTIPNHLKHLITVTGYLNFPEMYKYMEQADFFIPLLDPDNKDHARYLTSGVTGSIQLILGFRKIPIIQEVFADFYKLTSSNALIYRNELQNVMKQAIDMSPATYKEMQDALDDHAAMVFAKSKRNLKGMLS